MNLQLLRCEGFMKKATIFWHRLMFYFVAISPLKQILGFLLVHFGLRSSRWLEYYRHNNQRLIVRG